MQISRRMNAHLEEESGPLKGQIKNNDHCNAITMNEFEALVPDGIIINRFHC